jgi:hypothetical protein
MVGLVTLKTLVVFPRLFGFRMPGTRVTATGR